MTTQKVSEKRGNFLTILIIVNALLTLPSISTLGNAELIEQLTGKSLPWYPFYNVTMLIMTLGSLYGMWNLKKWGVYLWIAATVLQLIVLGYTAPEMMGGMWITVVIGGLWVWAIYPRWKYFK